MDYFKNDSDALAKTDKIINNLSAEQFRSYMNEINSGRKDAYLDFIKGAKKSKIDFNKKEFVQGKQFQKLTEEEKAKTIEQVTKENRSITSLKDLSAKLAHRIGGKVTFENNPNADWKGYNQGMTSVLNEAYMTPDTPFHEILAHPIIRAIKYVNANNQKTNEFLKSFKLNNSEFIDESDIGEGYFKDGKRISEEEFNKAIDEYSKITPLYQSLLKELETGKGKEVFEQVKRDYKYKDDKFKFNIDDYSEYLRLQQDTNYDGGSDDLLYYHYDNLKIIPTDDIKTINYLKKQGYKEIDYIKNNKSTLSNYSGYVYTPTKESYFVYIKDTNSKYTLEEQQEEAIVTLLGMMAADKLDAKKDATLISKLKELWEQISDFIKSLLKQDGIKIDELPITTTLNDLAEIMGYGNNKIILPGYKVEYSTPLGNKYDTLEEVNNEIRGLADADVEVDFSSIDIITFEDYQKDKKAINNLELRHGKFLVKKNLLGKETVYFKSNERKEAPFKVGDSFVKNWLEDGNYLNENLRSFIEKNKKYEQSREIIEQWKKENNIQYDPEEVYSRGQGFYSSIGAYSNLELDLLLKNLIQHIQDNKKAGGEFTISAFTKPIDKRVKHIEGTGDRVRFVIYPKSEHIKWAAPTDVYSGSVWDAHKKVSKDKKSELLGVSFTKAPDLININAVSPNLADIIDNLSHAHNELGIELTTNNFRLEYDDNIDYSTKKLIDNINKILDDKYGKLVKPEIKKPERKQVGYSLILDFNDGEISIIEDFKTEEEANNALIEQRKIQTREDLEQGYELKVLPKIEQGKQPTQTKENTTNIESVKSKLDKENYEKFGRQEAEEGMEFIYPEEHNKKEYTSQAEINLKVAALKEVARKYPRSLITSKVVPINPNMADNSEIQYSKVGSKQDIDGFKDFVNNKPVTSPSLTSKIEEVKKAYLDFSYQTRLDRVSMLTNMFSDKVTELLEQESPEGTYTLEELQENPELANKLKYKSNSSKRKDIIALQNLDDNNVFNLVKKDLIAFINTSEEDLKVQEFNRFKNIPLYSDLSSVETDYILPHFIQVKKREYQKVLDN